MPRIQAPVKTSGGKNYTADWIISLLPPRQNYHNFVDAMCRSCAVLLAHGPAGKSEVANDLDGAIMSFWRALQDDDKFEAFKRRVEAIPFSEQEFRDALARKAPYDQTDELSVAVRFFVAARQSRSGDLKDFATLTKTRLRRSQNEQVSAWLTSIERLPEVHARMKRVLLLSQDVFELLAEWDVPETCIYLDPPYVLEGGARATGGIYGAYDWSRESHEKLLDILLRMKKAYVVLSGYETKLYTDKLIKAEGWNMHTKEVPLHSAGGATKRRQVEVVWTNY